MFGEKRDVPFTASQRAKKTRSLKIAVQMEKGTFEFLPYPCSSASIRGKICSLRLGVSAVRILVEDELCRSLWMYIRSFCDFDDARGLNKIRIRNASDTGV